MCYSANASFVAGALLSVAAFATVQKAIRRDRSMLCFALFPAIFSLHQFLEAGVWLSLDNQNDGKLFRYLYILIAFLVWPILSPLASLAANRDRQLRPVLWLMLSVGLATTIYLAAKVASADGIDATRVGHSLSYRVDYDLKPPMYIDYLYAISAIVPIILLNNFVIRIYGVVLWIAFLYYFIKLNEVYFSVWCMTAAILSGLIFFSIPFDKKLAQRGD
jgi:hypothetical protein